jgi:hypothetical protein
LFILLFISPPLYCIPYCSSSYSFILLCIPYCSMFILLFFYPPLYCIPLSFILLFIYPPLYSLLYNVHPPIHLPSSPYYFFFPYTIQHWLFFIFFFNLFPSQRLREVNNKKYNAHCPVTQKQRVYRTGIINKIITTS